MAKPKLNGIIKRVITALVLVPVTVGILYFGIPLVNIFALVIGGLLAWEWTTMVSNKKPAFFAVCYSLPMALAVFMLPSCWLLAVILGAMLLITLKIKDEKYKHLLVLGVPYIALGIGAVVWLYSVVGYQGTLWFLLMVWSVDIGGYIVGTNLKGPKLAPKISPNKTWSGLIGGMFLAALVSCATAYVFGVRGGFAFYMLYGAAVALVAQMGDLLESAVKRHLGIKDSSNLIPGHGGVFDRLDGVLLAAPVLVLVIFLVSWWQYSF